LDVSLLKIIFTIKTGISFFSCVSKKAFKTNISSKTKSNKKYNNYLKSTPRFYDLIIIIRAAVADHINI